MEAFAVREFYAVVVGGSMLAAVAGYVNSIALLGVFSNPVSHVTGTVTKLAQSSTPAWAVAAAAAAPGGSGGSDGDTDTGVDRIAVVPRAIDAGALASTLSAFMVGAFTSGVIIGTAKFTLGRRYGVAMALQSLALVASCLALHLTAQRVGDILAAFACGLQNAMASSYSGAVLRTTHMTGIATDIACILGNATGVYVRRALRALRASCDTRWRGWRLSRRPRHLVSQQQQQQQQHKASHRQGTEYNVVPQASPVVSAVSEPAATKAPPPQAQAITDLWKLKVFVPLFLSFFIGGILGTTAHSMLRINALLPAALALALVATFYIIWRPTLDARLVLAAQLRRLQYELHSNLRTTLGGFMGALGVGASGSSSSNNNNNNNSNNSSSSSSSTSNSSAGNHIHERAAEILQSAPENIQALLRSLASAVAALVPGTNGAGGGWGGVSRRASAVSAAGARAAPATPYCGSPTPLPLRINAGVTAGIDAQRSVRMVEIHEVDRQINYLLNTLEDSVTRTTEPAGGASASRRTGSRADAEVEVRLEAHSRDRLAVSLEDEADGDDVAA